MKKRQVDESELTGWFAGRIPDDWFSGPLEITADRDEILIVGELPDPEVPEGASADAARTARIEGFREETRNRRIRIALEAQARFRRKVSWGANCGDVTRVFTVLSVPAMTRLRLEERSVLDTLVDAGVARSRSEALAWCVRLVAKNQDEWLGDLRSAFTAVAKVRAEGPQVF
jgi:hypothetical protein